MNLTPQKLNDSKSLKMENEIHCYLQFQRYHFQIYIYLSSFFFQNIENIFHFNFVFPLDISVILHEENNIIYYI
jgi:reverse gyrase